MPAKKAGITKSETVKTGTPRKRKLDAKTAKKVQKQKSEVPGSFRLLALSLKHIWVHKKLFAGILVIYAVLYFIFVKGFAADFQLTGVREVIDDVAGEELGTIGTATALFGVLLGTVGSTNSDAASLYQSILLVVISLSVIWALRVTYEKQEEPTIRNSFYSSMYPLVPYVLVWFVILLQTIPALIAISIYGIVQNNGLAISALEQMIWLIMLLAGFCITFYLVSSSIFASYIVTLHGMTPVRALLSAKKLIKYRRFMIIRKVAFLPFILFIAAAAILLPLVLYVPVLAEIIFLLYSLAIILIGHSYMYSLYRELL